MTTIKACSQASHNTTPTTQRSRDFFLKTPKQCQTRRNHRLWGAFAAWAAVLALAGWGPESWAGSVSCTRNGVVVPPRGILNIGDKLICSNQGFGGGDVDIFTIKGIAGSCISPYSQVFALGTGQTADIERQLQVTFSGFVFIDNINVANLEEGKTSVVNIDRKSVV